MNLETPASTLHRYDSSYATFSDGPLTPRTEQFEATWLDRAMCSFNVPFGRVSRSLFAGRDGTFSFNRFFAAMRLEHLPAKLKIPTDLENDGSVHWLPFERHSAHESVVANNTNGARNPC